jgi:predicted amidophosphoribosyltransferase
MPEETKTKLCPECGKEIPASARRCPLCDYPCGVDEDLSRVAARKKKEKPAGPSFLDEWL